MSVTAEIETRYRTNVITVPIQSVTTRFPKGAQTNAVALVRNDSPAANSSANGSTPAAEKKKLAEAPKAREVVFLVDGLHAKMVPVKRGISDDNYVEITEGLKEDQEVVS